MPTKQELVDDAVDAAYALKVALEACQAVNVDVSITYDIELSNDSTQTKTAIITDLAVNKAEENSSYTIKTPTPP